MKRIIYISFIILFSSNLKGQDTIIDSFQNYIPYSVYEGPNLNRNVTSDSFKIELRLWIFNFQQPAQLLQIRQNIESEWEYKFGYFRNTDSIMSFLYKNIKNHPTNWKDFKLNLDTFIKVDIPDQKKIELVKIRGGKKYQVENSAFFSRIIDGVEYTIEIFENKTYKIIHYNNPHSYLEDLEKDGFSTSAHKDLIRFVDYLHKEFELNKLFALQLEEIYKENKN